MEPLHVLNLGAGVQSSAIYLLCCEPDARRYPLITAAIFSDTQEEPESVYRHLEWLQKQKGPPIMIRSAGKLGDDIIHGRPGKRRFASIPAYVRVPGQEREGMVRRQCSAEYKVEVCTRTIRHELLGLRPRQRCPKGTMVYQYFGFSTDEAARAERAKRRFEQIKWSKPVFPLIEMGWSRRDCVAYLKDRVPHETPKSACTFCPFKTNQAWKQLKDTDPQGWARAVEIDEGIRRPDAVCGRGLEGQLYLHRSLVPLKMIDFDQLKPNTLDPMTAGECTGMCGL